VEERRKDGRREAKQPNQQCHYIIFFGGSNSTSDCNLADDLKLNVFYGNLSLGRTKEQSNIDGSNSVDPTVMELSDDHDDQDEQDDGGPYYWNEIET
jgi:hypothetical protein